jgi:CDP-diacylglycerol--glycerol-3-phosphate 3-phosphatidyltransferase
VAAALVAAGWLTVGGLAFLLASAFDMLDGAVARATGTTSRFGAFLDSVVDRYDEALMFVALLVTFSLRSDVLLVLGAAVALTGSLLVSYARARAEGLGLDCEIGWLQRPERVVLMGAGLIAAPWLLAPVVWVLAVVTNITVVQRVLFVRRLLRDADDPSPEGIIESERHRA